MHVYCAFVATHRKEQLAYMYIIDPGIISCETVTLEFKICILEVIEVDVYYKMYRELTFNFLNIALFRLHNIE